MKKTLFSPGLMACLLLLAFCGSLLAQGTAPTSASATAPIKLLPCEEAVKAAMPDAQAKANAECRTIHYCVDCLHNAAQVCRPVTANPICPYVGQVSSPMSMTKTTAAGTGKADAVPAPADPFEVIVVQSVCYAGGVTVEPFVTGTESVAVKDRMASAKERQSRYTFFWTVDGKKMGNLARLECITGKEAELTATDNATKKSITKTIKLPSTGGTGGVNNTARVPSPTSGGINEGEIIAAFKKTSCFGTCPVYEVKFYSNGTASWDGYMNVARMGHFETTLGPDVIGKIQEKAFALKYFELASKYPTSFTVVDAPSTITYVRLGGKEKQVENIMEAPQRLIDFENLIYDEIVKLGWKADPPKKMESMKTTAPANTPKN